MTEWCYLCSKLMRWPINVDSFIILSSTISSREPCGKQIKFVHSSIKCTVTGCPLVPSAAGEYGRDQDLHQIPQPGGVIILLVEKPVSGRSLRNEISDS